MGVNQHVREVYRIIVGEQGLLPPVLHAVLKKVVYTAGESIVVGV
jgi:hypothetical protein